MGHRTRRSPLGYENLEPRNMLAGDVTVVENGHLFIRGDAQANQISIVADNSGQVAIRGIGTTTVNGSAKPFIVESSVDLDGLRGRNALFEGGLRIQMYGGADRIDVQGIEFGALSHIGTGNGHDVIRFVDSSSLHHLRTFTGQGNDTFNFVRSRAHGDLSIRTSVGDDSIRIRNSRTWGDTDLFSGADDDSVTLNSVRLSGTSQRIIAFEGNDRISIRNNHVNEVGLNIFAGDGRDHVFAEMADSDEVEGEILVAGQDGYDMLDVHADESMMDVLVDSGFVHEENAEGAWYVYDRGDAVDTPDFSYWASSVEFAETRSVTAIDWLGTYFNSDAPAADNFVIEIFESEAIESTAGGYWYQQPSGEAVATFEVGDEAHRMETGIHLTQGDGEPNDGIPRESTQQLYSYSAAIDFEFLADTTYWISIFNILETDQVIEQHGHPDFEFGIIHDYPGEPGEFVEYVQPTGSQTDPFKNTNAVLFGSSASSGLEPDRWHFSSADIKTLFVLRD